MIRLLLVPLLLASSFSAAGACSAPLLDFQFRPLAARTPVDLCAHYQGKVLLVVNTASKCGLTPQYEGLEALHARLKDRGFAVLGFPANDFLGQEPGSEDEIREFCTSTYGVQFPMFEKVVVTGDQATPFYQALARESGGSWPQWNFHKYLIGRDGRLLGDFGSRTPPDDPALVGAIEAALAQPEPAGS